MPIKQSTGTWLPAVVPNNSKLTGLLMLTASIMTSTSLGYDQSMINGLNILPSYNNYFNLDPATEGLQTGSIFIGGVLAGLCWGQMTDRLGRRVSLFWAATITILAVILQTAAQNISMFVVARILIGFGTIASGCAGPPYLAEALPLRWRGWGLGLLNDCYYVGGLIAAGVTSASFKIESTWAWRLPSAIQGIFSVSSIGVLFFIPESPRWLVHRGEHRLALTALAKTHANGNEKDIIVLTAFKEIVDTLNYEREHNQQLSLMQCFRSPSARRRIFLACTAAVFSVITGNVIASYFLGNLLTDAGITDPTAQLKINIILNVWSLVCALVGTFGLNRFGRKSTTLISQSLLTVFIFLLGALTKVYGTSNNKPGTYGTVAAVFLFMGAYSYGWTPILCTYPPEVLNFPIRAVGTGVFQVANNCAAVLFTFAMPIALSKISWKLYFINGAWDVLLVLVIRWLWVETKDKSLEEIDAIFEGTKHSNAPDLSECTMANRL